MIINKKLAKMMTEKPIKADVSVKENKLYLYGGIGDHWDGVTLDDVKNTVNELDKNSITVHINSYGGDATEGVAIRNFLKDSFETIDVVIDGIAASAASVIATCGDTLTMPTGTTFMIHNPWTFFIGNRQDLIREAKTLESLEQSYRNIYMERFTGTEEDLIELMDDESWLTAEQSMEFGFADVSQGEVDEVIDEEPEESPLVAQLLVKYANESKKDEVIKDDKPKGKDNKQFMSNFARLFGQTTNH